MVTMSTVGAAGGRGLPSRLQWDEFIRVSYQTWPARVVAPAVPPHIAVSSHAAAPIRAVRRALLLYVCMYVLQRERERVRQR
jgi:hypothetical protein